MELVRGNEIIGRGKFAVVYASMLEEEIDGEFFATTVAEKVARTDLPGKECEELVNRGYRLGKKINDSQLIRAIPVPGLPFGTAVYEKADITLKDYLKQTLAVGDSDESYFQSLRTGDIEGVRRRLTGVLRIISPLLRLFQRHPYLAHLDAKGENIGLFLKEDGTVDYERTALLDLDGLVVQKGNGEYLAPNKLLMSPFFEPPEVFEPEDIHPNSDVYSLGATIYNSLAYRYGEDTWELVLAPEVFKSFKRLDPQRDIESLVVGMVDKDPDARLSPAEAADEIDRILENIS